MIPGPVTIHPRVYRAMGKPVYYHRSEEFGALLAEVTSMLKKVIQTKNDVFVITGSGTSAMEAAIANCVSPGDKVLNILGGNFAQRWMHITEAFGGISVKLPIEWGKAADPENVSRILDENPDIKFVTLCHNETSTGVLNPADEIGRIVRKHDKILIVDGITSVGGDYVYPDRWGFDILVTGSQKCLGAPPGLGMIMIGERAWQLIRGRKTMPAFYLDLQAYEKSISVGQTPYTPVVPLINALRESLAMILEEGYETRVERHRLLARATRAGFRELGLELFADREHPSNTVTSVRYPEGVGDEFRRIVKRHGVLVAGGQALLRGKIFRVAHMNICGQREILATLAVSELALKGLGYDVELGKGVSAAEQFFLEVK